MKCEICQKEVEKTIPFYWGFFENEYNPEKWINACQNCCKEFLRASNISNQTKKPLINIETKIKTNTRKRTK